MIYIILTLINAFSEALRSIDVGRAIPDQTTSTWNRMEAYCKVSGDQLEKVTVMLNSTEKPNHAGKINI